MIIQWPVTPGLLCAGPAGMTGANIATLITLLAGAAAMTAIAVAGIAHLRRQHFRSRIEAIRDDGIDAVLDGRVRHRSSVAAFLDGLDMVASCAPWVSLTALAAALPSLLPGGDPSDLPGACRDLTAGEQYIIGELRVRLRAAIRWYLIWPVAVKPARLDELAVGRRS